MTSHVRLSIGPSESTATTLRQLVRAIAGGLLLGLPPLFTMEMWFHGFLLHPWKIMVLVVFTFVIVVGYSAFAGFRHERTWPDLIIDSVQTMGIAAVVAAFALWLLGRIGPAVGLRDAIGKIGLQMIPISLGVALAATQLADPDDRGDDAADRGTAFDTPGARTFGRLFVVAGAALFLSLNIAPTEETMLLAIDASWWLLVFVLLTSLLMSYAIVFYAEFRGGRAPSPAGGPFGHPLVETVAAYAISLLVSALLLWSFGYTASMNWYGNVAQIVLLGVVAAFGGAAGRLLLGGGATNNSDAAP